MRYGTLDALRGVAALTILMLHLGEILHLPPMRHGYLAVDFFFCLSGFILATTYEPKLRTNLAAGEFIGLRLIRLYPVFLVGVLLGAPVIAAQIFAHNPHAMAPADAVIGFAANAAMLPAPVSGALFPFDKPAWSLFFELAVNVLFGLVLFRLSFAKLTVVAALCGALFFAAIWSQGHASAGFDWSGFVTGALRTVFSFAVGILIARVHPKIGRRRSIISIAILPMLMGVLFFDNNQAWDGLYDILAVSVALPGITLLGASFDLPAGARLTGVILGDLSYPLYAIHYPIVQGAGFLLARRLDLPPAYVALAIAAGVISFAWALARFYDGPARAWLGRISTKDRADVTALP